MKLQNIKTLIIVLLGCISLNAQETISYPAYKEALHIINPSQVGVTNKKGVMLMARLRTSTPKDSRQYLSFSTPMGKNLSTGISVINDSYHINKETQVYIDFSYKLKLNEQANMFLGLKGGGDFISRDFQSLGLSDPEFSESINGQFSPNFGMGAYLDCGYYFVSVSIPKFLESKYDNRMDISTVVSSPYVFINSGYTFELKNDMKLTPSLMYQITTGSYSESALELGVNFEFMKNFELGIANRFGHSFSALAMVKFMQRCKLGFTYMSLTQDLNLNSYGIIFKVQF